MFHGFRARLLSIVATAALAFVLLVASSVLLASRVTHELEAIQQNHLPRLELGPKLESEFERLRRDLQDAVAAQDNDALVATQVRRDALLRNLTAARGWLRPERVAAAQNAVNSYYDAAREVCRRMIAGETGESLIEAASSMQAKQKNASEQLRLAAAFEPHQLSAAFAEAANAQATANRVRLVVSIVCLAIVLLFSLWLSRGVLRSIEDLTAGLGRFGKGDFAQPIRVLSADELGQLAEHANRMAESLRTLNEERDRHDWLRNGQAELARDLRGELEPSEVATHTAHCLARYLNAPAAAVYWNESDGLRLLGHYANSAVLVSGQEPAAQFRRGEGLVGQAALQQDALVVTDLPPDHMKVQSGLGSSSPRALVFLPLIHGTRVSGVLELALFRPWTPLQAELLASVRDVVAIALEVARARSDLRALLLATQTQAERLSAQEEELRAANEELQSQQEELRQTNDELTQQAQELEEQRRALEHRNGELLETRASLERKTEELLTVSAYKSQFLANMSHELRTPLNSMLLLSSLLAENEPGNLTNEQVEYSSTIHGAGKDLLQLINQVLDLAKIESGKQTVHIETISLRGIVDYCQRIFAPLAHDKGLELKVELASDLPDSITNDPRRVEQILNNLLGNAIKFTERGSVTLRIARPDPTFRFDEGSSLQTGECVAFSVTDTGIGISREHQERIFAPFEQAEAAADRRYGGTGLGLTIARELAGLLGGQLTLQSTPGVGSTFTCHLPLVRSTSANDRDRSRTESSADASGRNSMAHEPGDAAATSRDAVQLLVVEDDPVFARVIEEIVSGLGLKAVVTGRGQTALRLAREHKPRGIILDVKLPDIDGFAVMAALRADPTTADIAVHFVSAVDGEDRGIAMGAIGYLTKPASRSDLVRVVESLAPERADQRLKVLIIEDDVSVAESLVERLRTEAIESRRVTSARQALAAIADEQFGCLVLDLSLPDMDGLEFLQELSVRSGAAVPPVVVYTGRALSKTEAQRLEAYAQSVVLKEEHSTDRVVSEVRLFARRLKQALSPRGASVIAPEATPLLRLDGCKILVADDDMRTVYAMCALLRARGAIVMTADTGRAALDVLAEHPDVEAVLMDIMMPEMDGYEAMRRIRSEPRFAALPIIALTAKAMKIDREKCIEAGATDYLPKPLDGNRLLERLRGCFAERGHA